MGIDFEIPVEDEQLQEEPFRIVVEVVDRQVKRVLVPVGYGALIEASVCVTNGASFQEGTRLTMPLDVEEVEFTEEETEND